MIIVVMMHEHNHEHTEMEFHTYHHSINFLIGAISGISL